MSHFSDTHIALRNARINQVFEDANQALRSVVFANF